MHEELIGFGPWMKNLHAMPPGEHALRAVTDWRCSSTPLLRYKSNVTRSTIALLVSTPLMHARHWYGIASVRADADVRLTSPCTAAPLSQMRSQDSLYRRNSFRQVYRARMRIALLTIYSSTPDIGQPGIRPAQRAGIRVDSFPA